MPDVNGVMENNQIGMPYYGETNILIYIIQVTFIGCSGKVMGNYLITDLVNVIQLYDSHNYIMKLVYSVQY